MIVFRDPAEIPADFGPSIVAIGKFDGVHSGHRAVLRKARVDAAGTGYRVVAVTFDRHPLSVLRPEVRPPQNVVGVSQKLRLLAETGIDATLLLTFDAALATLTPREFVQHVLVAPLQTRMVLVGHDFRFGKGGAGNPLVLTELGAEFGFTVEVIDDVRAVGTDRRVSSTWIREALAVGDVETAGRLLGHPPALVGEVVHGFKRGRELGFPTANLSEKLEGFVPADGVYAGWLIDEGGPLRPGIRYPAAISVGTNPTFDDVASRQVESYVLDETGLDLYGHKVEVEFVERIRGMTAFEGIEQLKVQIAADVDLVREALTRAVSGSSIDPRPADAPARPAQ